MPATPPAPLTLRAGDSRAVLVPAGALADALAPLAPDVLRAAIVERVWAAGLDQTRAHGGALATIAAAAGTDLPADLAAAWLALEVVQEGRALVRLWPIDVSGAEVIAWLGAHAPDPAAAAATGERIRDLASLDGQVDVGLAARAFLAMRAIEADRARRFVALDAGAAHHALLGGMRDLPKSRKRKVATPTRDGWAEIIHPHQQLALRLDVRELPEQIIAAVRAWRSWQGLRHWAALQVLFTDAGRTGMIRWTLDGHLDALGYSDRARRDPQVRATVADEVEALTRMELALYHPDGTLRLRGSLLAVTQRGEALRGERWALEGLELKIHPAVYEGVRQANGTMGRLWAPAPVELARINHGSFPHALVLGLILPIRWRWDSENGRDHVTLKGAKLLEAAGIKRSDHDPGRAWDTLDRNLAVLQVAGGLGRVEWTPGEDRTPTGLCRLYPAQWVRERLVHRIAPVELPLAPSVLTGKELRAWRRGKGWTQAEAAQQLGVSLRTIERAEAAADGRLGPALADALTRDR